MDNSRIKREYILQCLDEFNEIRQKPGKKTGKNETSSILETALFIEDMFGIVLTDDEICEENLRKDNNLEDFVFDKQEF